VRGICGPYPLYLIAGAEQFVDNSAGLLSVPAVNFTQGRNRCFKVFITDAVFNVGYGQPNRSLAQRMQDCRREVLKLPHQRGCNLKRSHTDSKESQRSNDVSLLDPTAFGCLKSLDFLPQTCAMTPVDGLPAPTEIFQIMKHHPDATTKKKIKKNQDDLQECTQKEKWELNLQPS